METPSSRTTSDLISKSLETTQETPGQKISKEMEALSGMILKAMGDPAYVESVCPSGGCPELKGLLLEVAEKAKEGGDSPEVKACVSKKIPILMEEGYEQKQAIAIAFSMCRKDPSAHEKDLAKEGTSEGAKRGWETRRGGGPSEEVAGLPPISEREKEHERMRIANARDKHAQGKDDFDRSMLRRMDAIRDPAKMRAFAHALDEANERFLLGEAELRLESMGFGMDGKPKKFKPIAKAGTSEGAKKGWETRLRGDKILEVDPFANVRDADDEDKAKIKGILDWGSGSKILGKYEVGARVKYAGRKWYIMGSQLNRRTPDVPDLKLITPDFKQVVEGARIKNIEYFGRDDKPARQPDERAPVAKEGTSEGAKRGWETRREGGSAPESKPEEKPEEYPPEAERARQQHHQAATDILGQLGGKRLSVMTGARDMVAIPGKANMGGLQMSIPMARGPKGGVNRVRVEVDPSDTYHVEFGRERAGKYTVVSSHEGVYNDQLMDLFEAETGLFLTLHPRKGLEALQAATEDLISKAGTSEGAKLGWETRRSGGEAEEVAERVAGLPSREQWDSMEADVGDIYEVAERANRTVRDIDAHDEAMREEGRRPPRGVRAGPGEPAPEHPKVEEALGKMEDAAPKGVRAAEGLRGVPGVDEAKRKNAEDSMRRWAKVGVSEREMPKYTEVTVDLANMLDSARADHDPKYLEGTEPAIKPAVGMARKGLALDLGVQKRFLNLQDLGQYRPTKPEDVRPPRESTRHDGELGLKMDAQKRLLAEEDFKPVRPLRTDPNPVATGLGRMIMPGWARKGGQVAPPSDVPKDRIVGDGLTEMFLPSKKEDETKE